MSFLDDGVAVITGAGSGMGRCLAQQLAAKGASLALADIKQEGLDATVASLGNAGGKVTTHIVNVAEESQVRVFAESVEREHGRATVLFNNAGVALLGHLEEISLEQGRVTRLHRSAAPRTARHQRRRYLRASRFRAHRHRGKRPGGRARWCDVAPGKPGAVRQSGSH